MTAHFEQQKDRRHLVGREKHVHGPGIANRDSRLAEVVRFGRARVRLAPRVVEWWFAITAQRSRRAASTAALRPRSATAGCGASSAAARLTGTTSAPKLQPIAARLVMLQSGMRAPMGVKVKGPSLEAIETAALAIEAALKDLLAYVPIWLDSIERRRALMLTKKFSSTKKARYTTQI